MKLDHMTGSLTTSGAFLTAAGGGKTNVMTISWGMFGMMWHKEMVMVMVRPQRYTRRVLETAEDFTVSVPLGALEWELGECGTKSGADTDKSKIVEFVPAKAVKSPVVKGCGAYYECRILYRGRIDGSGLPDEVREFYEKEDYHYLYFGEVMAKY